MSPSETTTAADQVGEAPDAPNPQEPKKKKGFFGRIFKR
jgi:hypothetical protein